MYKLNVGTVERYEDLDAGETRLRVPFQIVEPIVDEVGEPVLEDGEPTFNVLLERNESFPLGTSQDDIMATLKRHLEVFTAERAREEESKARQAQLDAADEVAGEISNITIE